jgi:hypothetical protein
MSKTEGGASAEGQSDSETHLVRIAAVVCQVKARERGARGVDETGCGCLH